MTDRAQVRTEPAETLPETPGTVVGNLYDKYAARNPLIRWLTARFLADLEEVLDELAASSPQARVLEVGCGEGEITARLRRRWDSVTALDLPDAGLRRRWSSVEGARFLHANAEQLPFGDDAFDIVVSIEVFEHLLDPLRGLAELARVGRGHLLLSVPREPLFRMGNLLTGRHLGALGNTPGHLNHWSSRRFQRFVAAVATVQRRLTPFPWTIVWAALPRDRDRAASAYGAGAG